MHLTDDEVIALMDVATQMREQLESKMTKIRACKRECAYRKYYYDKQHSALIAEAIQTPAGFGDFGADLSTMQVEEGMEIIPLVDNPKYRGGKKISRKAGRRH